MSALAQLFNAPVVGHGKTRKIFKLDRENPMVKIEKPKVDLGERSQMANLNRSKGPRTIFAKLTFATVQTGKGGTYPFEAGTYEGNIDTLTLLEDTAEAIRAEIERRKAK